MGLLEIPAVPDFEEMKKCILRKKTPDRVHFFEFYQDPPIKNAIDERFSLARSLDRHDPCTPGGYCLGSGNSIARYVPVENYLIMLDEGRRWNI